MKKTFAVTLFFETDQDVIYTQDVISSIVTDCNTEFVETDRLTLVSIAALIGNGTQQKIQ